MNWKQWGEWAIFIGIAVGAWSVLRLAGVEVLYATLLSIIIAILFGRRLPGLTRTTPG
jgi:hypothetical protein